MGAQFNGDIYQIENEFNGSKIGQFSTNTRAHGIELNNSKTNRFVIPD